MTDDDKLTKFIIGFAWIFVGGIAYQTQIEDGTPENAIPMFIMAFPLGIICCMVAMMSVYIPYGIFGKFLNGENLDLIDYLYLLSD